MRVKNFPHAFGMRSKKFPTVAETVAALRSARGWSTVRLAAEADLTEGTIRNVEQGFLPHSSNLIAIAQALGVTVGALLGEDTSDAAALERALPGWGRLDAAQQATIRTLVAGLAPVPELDPADRAAVEEWDREAQRRTRRGRVAEDPPAAADGPRGA